MIFISAQNVLEDPSSASRLLSRLRSGLEWPWEGRTVTVWCKGFLKAHAALWKPAVRWALSAGGVKAGFVGRHKLLFTKDNYRERNELGGSFHLTALALGISSLANSRCARSFTAIGRWGWRPCRGE